MAYLNENYLKLQAGYLFPEIARRVRQFSEEEPEAAKRLIRCGIGDVTEPLPRAAIEALKAAAEELGQRETFRGYGPEQGYRPGGKVRGGGPEISVHTGSGDIRVD